MSLPPLGYYPDMLPLSKADYPIKVPFFRLIDPGIFPFRFNWYMKEVSLSNQLNPDAVAPSQACHLEAPFLGLIYPDHLSPLLSPLNQLQAC
jgi:hypothetical protein